MKSLTRIRLVNWHFFENITISCVGTTYLIGVNGVGKSTILDAVQFALVGGQRDVKFNQAAVAGGKRTLASYVRGELGMESQKFLRGDATGIVALEFRNPDNTHFVHGAVIDGYEDGRSPDVIYFLIHNATLNDEWFFKSEGIVFDTRAFKRHIEHFSFPRNTKAETFTRVEDYRFHLLNRLGQLRESFPSKIVKGLAFTPLTDIRAFVHNFLLDETLVDVKTLQAQLETLRHFEDLAINIRERIDALNKIDELDRERLNNARLRITNGYVRRRAQSEAHLTALKSLRVKLDETRLELSRAGLQRDELNENYKRANAALVDAQVALQTDVTATRERELKEKITALDSQLRELKAQEKNLIELITAEAKDAARLIDLLAADSKVTPSPLNELIAKPKPPILNLQSLISDLQSLGNDYANDEALLKDRVRLLREEGEQIENEIRQLRTGDRETSYDSEAPEASRLRRLLRAELGLSPNDVIYLCTALQVPDESWQDAVEGVLGNNRFTLLVPPQHFNAAMRLYRELRQKEKLHGVGLLDSERIIKHARNAQSESLATEVESAHPAARAFIDLVLGGTIKCDSLEAMRDQRTAITRECFVRRNFTDSHLNPHFYRRWFIGDRAIPRRIELLEARLKEIADEMVSLGEKTNAIRERLALTRDKVRMWIDIEHRLPQIEGGAVMAAQLKSFKAELAALDTRNAQSLRAEVDRCQKEFDRLKSELDDLNMKIGGLDRDAKVIADETLPNRERAADAATQDAQTFVAGETANEILEDLNHEYARRRERQPLETILENATRYEHDYTNAEQRSRDKLREAKQAYSFKYDFGLDEDENAERYKKECDKFVSSELPQYEAQIAGQRKLAEQELVENFIHKLREQIDDAKQQLDYLNTTLRDLRFGGERFEFITKATPTLKQVYDMIMDSQQILGDSLFESDFRQKHQQGWDLLFERLTANGADDSSRELRELQDYRNYLEYDIRIHYPGGDRALLSLINAKKSGGETTTPFYVAMAASFAQAYRLNQPRGLDTIRLALFDEAFSKMDTARTASALKFMRDIGLQVLLATPPDKSGALLPFVDSVRTVVRKDNHSFVIEIDKAEMESK